MPVNYEMKEAKPETVVTISFRTVGGEMTPTEEDMGYCLIPSNKAQKLLIILGKGGEGKSRIGLVMKNSRNEYECK